MNQEQLAALAGVTQETISKAERGIVPLSRDVQERIAVVLGVSRQDIFPESQAVGS